MQEQLTQKLIEVLNQAPEVVDQLLQSSLIGNYFFLFIMVVFFVALYFVCMFFIDDESNRFKRKVTTLYFSLTIIFLSCIVFEIVEIKYFPKAYIVKTLTK
jgi:ABC-type multidrug transport system permease subunit